MFNRKSNAASANEAWKQVQERDELLANLAVLYPVIRETGHRGYWIGPDPLWARYRVSAVKRAAEASRVAADKKATDALLREFRAGRTPSDAGSES